jgi:hypothetical protein
MTARIPFARVIWARFGCSWAGVRGGEGVRGGVDAVVGAVVGAVAGRVATGWTAGVGLACGAGAVWARAAWADSRAEKAKLAEVRKRIGAVLCM